MHTGNWAGASCCRAAAANVQAAQRLKAAAHVPGRHLTTGGAGWPPCRRHAHGYGLCDRAGGVRSMRGTRRSRAQGALMRLNSIPDGPVVAESDPLPPDDRRSPLRGDSFLDRLYRTHHDRLLRFIRRRARDEHAHDVVQRVFCRLAGLSEGEQRRIVAPHAYLRRAADNMLRDDARRDDRHSIALHVAEDEVQLRSGDQVAALEARDRLRRLEAALMRLKPRTREIFLAHRIDGYSYAEIAARTGLSIKTVEMHMTRAIAYLDQSRLKA